MSNTEFQGIFDLNPGYNTRNQLRAWSDIPEKGSRSKSSFMTQGNSASDGRRWSRHKIDVRLRVAIGGPKGSFVFGRGNILSQGGMGAYIPSSLAIGTEVLIQVTFPYSPAEVTLKAIVRNCEGFRYGLEFTDLADDVRSLIVKNCNSSALLQ